MPSYAVIFLLPNRKIGNKTLGMKNGNEFWERVGASLSSQGLQYKDLAEAIGTTRPLLSRWKNAGQLPNITYIGKIASYLECSIDYLLGTDEVTPFGILQIPLISQRLSCGKGELWDSEVESTSISIMERLAAGQDKESLVAAIVKGDSMIGASLYDGDMVVFSRGLVSGNGIYAIAIDGEVYVKRLAWNPITRVVTIISENPAYEPMTVNMDDGRLVILGKVTGWLHTNR